MNVSNQIFTTLLVLVSVQIRDVQIAALKNEVEQSNKQLSQLRLQKTRVEKVCITHRVIPVSCEFTIQEVKDVQLSSEDGLRRAKMEVCEDGCGNRSSQCCFHILE